MTEDIYYRVDGTTLHLNSSGGSGWTKATAIGHLFGDWKSNHDITKAVIDEPIHPTDGGGMFFDLTNLTAIEGLENLDTSSVTDMIGMFDGCDSLTSLDLSTFDTSSVTDMSNMFSYCHSLTSLDLSGWDTSKVTDMRHMFEGCPALQSLDLSGWDTSNVINMRYMFDYCVSLKTVATEDQRIISAVPDGIKVVDPTARAGREAATTLGDAIGQAASACRAADEGHTGHTDHNPR